MSFNLTVHIDHRLKELPRYRKTKYDQLLNLSSNEINHWRMQQLYRDFAQQFSVDLPFKYPYYPDAQEVLANFYKLSIENILISPGSDEAIKMLMYTLGKNTRRLILQVPNYQNYVYYADACGINIDQFTYIGKSYSAYLNEFIINLNQAAPSTVIITNPNGFTGSSIKNEDLILLIDICYKKNHILVIDEAYAAFNDLHHLNLAVQNEHVVVLLTFSKALGTAGLRIAGIFSSTALIDYFARWNGSSSVSIHSIHFMEYCLKHYNILKQIHKEIIETKDSVCCELRNLFPNWFIYESNTNFILVDTGSPETIASIEQHLRKNGIIIRTHSNVEGLAACFRMTISESKHMDKVIILLNEWQKSRNLDNAEKQYFRASR